MGEAMRPAAGMVGSLPAGQVFLRTAGFPARVVLSAGRAPVQVMRRGPWLAVSLPARSPHEAITTTTALVCESGATVTGLTATEIATAGAGGTDIPTLESIPTGGGIRARRTIRTSNTKPDWRMR